MGLLRSIETSEYLLLTSSNALSLARSTHRSIGHSYYQLYYCRCTYIYLKGALDFHVDEPDLLWVGH